MINSGDPVKAQIVNDAFMSRKADTSTIGKVSLLKPFGSGPVINDAQKFINQIAATVGTFEGDSTSLDYATNHVVLDGDPYKVAIEKLDVYSYTLRQDLDALDAREASNNSSQQALLNNHEGRLVTIESQPSTFGGDKTFSDDVSIQSSLSVTGSTTLSTCYASSASITNLSADQLSVTQDATVGNNLSVSNSASVGNDLSVTDSLTVGGALTANSVQASTGNISSLSVSTLSASGSVSADSLSITNNATIGADLTVSGNLFVNGTQTVLNSVQLTVNDKRITLNKNGLASSGGSAGIEIEEASSITGYIEVTSSRDSWSLKAPNRPGVVVIEPDSTATTLTINRALFDSKADVSSLGALAYKNTVATNDIDNLAVTNSKIDDLAVDTQKLANSAVTLAKLANDSVDEGKIVSTAVDGFTIVGGSGQKLFATSAYRGYLPSSYRVAGEAIPAGVVFCRYGIVSSGETASNIYIADNDFSLNKFNVAVVCVSSTPVASNSTIQSSRLYQFGLVTLQTSVFPTSDIGKKIYLTSSGGYSSVAPTASGSVVVELGTVVDTNAFLFNPKLIGVN